MSNCLALIGRRDDAHALYERLLALRNDVGLLAEEYDVPRQRQVGNFPQAFSHVALIHTGLNLMRHEVGMTPTRDASGEAAGGATADATAYAQQRKSDKGGGNAYAPVQFSLKKAGTDAESLDGSPR
jgi:hypothetical protein